MNKQNKDVRAEELRQLKCEAELLIRAIPEADQIVVVKTAGANIYHCNGSIENMDDLMRKLSAENDKEIQFIVCMWNNFCLDVPSIYFRTKLLQLCPRNSEAYILLQGENVLVGKRLAVTMP